MANVKITDLTALSGGDVASNDVLPIVDINVDQTKKIAISEKTEDIKSYKTFLNAVLKVTYFIYGVFSLISIYFFITRVIF